MEMDERDYVVFQDEEGNEFELDVIDYFEHDGEEYAILMDMNVEAEDEEELESEVYIMKVIVKDDIEEFVPPDDDKYEALIAIAEERLTCNCEEEDEDCDDENCGCGCSCGCKPE